MSPGYYTCCHREYTRYSRQVEIDDLLLVVVMLTCQRCGYAWEYQGRMKYFATCPQCYYKVRIVDEGADGDGQRTGQ